MQKGSHTNYHKCRDHFIYSKPSLSALFFPFIERSVFMALFCYYKDMLGENPEILSFSLLPKESS